MPIKTVSSIARKKAESGLSSTESAPREQSASATDKATSPSQAAEGRRQSSMLAGATFIPLNSKHSTAQSYL